MRWRIGQRVILGKVRILVLNISTLDYLPFCLDCRSLASSQSGYKCWRVAYLVIILAQRFNRRLLSVNFLFFVDQLLMKIRCWDLLLIVYRRELQFVANVLLSIQQWYFVALNVVMFLNVNKLISIDWW
jgi:hypothetical protein